MPKAVSGNVFVSNDLGEFVSPIWFIGVKKIEYLP